MPETQGESPPVVQQASREEDSSCLPANVERKIRIRLGMTYGGLIITVGGVILALTDHDLAYLGMASALIGAGAVDPSLVMNFFRGNK